MAIAYTTRKNKRLGELSSSYFYSYQKNIIFKNHSFLAVGNLAYNKIQFLKTTINCNGKFHCQKYLIFKNNNYLRTKTHGFFNYEQIVNNKKLSNNYLTNTI